MKEEEDTVTQLKTKGKSWLNKAIDKVGNLGLKVVKGKKLLNLEIKFAGEVLLESSGLMKSE